MHPAPLMPFMDTRLAGLSFMTRGIYRDLLAMAAKMSVSHVAMDVNHFANVLLLQPPEVEQSLKELMVLHLVVPRDEGPSAVLELPMLQRLTSRGRRSAQQDSDVVERFEGSKELPPAFPGWIPTLRFMESGQVFMVTESVRLRLLARCPGVTAAVLDATLSQLYAQWCADEKARKPLVRVLAAVESALLHAERA